MFQINHAPKSYDHIHNDQTQLLNQTVSSGQFALCSGVDLRYHSTQAPSYTGTVFPSWKAAKDRTQADTPTNIQLNHSVANVSLSNDKQITFMKECLQDLKVRPVLSKLSLILILQPQFSFLLKLVLIYITLHCIHYFTL